MSACERLRTPADVRADVRAYVRSYHAARVRDRALPSAKHLTAEPSTMGMPQPQARFERADFLAWEAEQPSKHEYLAGEVFAMVGARQAHVLVAGALFARLREHLHGTRCRAYTSDMKLEVLAVDAIFYPDAMVSCDEADRQRAVALQAPCLIVEVLSDSTAAYDRGPKFAAYRQVPSLQEYLLVDIDRRQIELFRRQSEGWVLHDASGEPRQLMLSSVNLLLVDADVFGDLVE